MCIKMLPLLLLMCSALLYSNAHEKVFRADYRYIEPMNAFYKFHTYAKSWLDAKERCEAEGAKLFYPKNRAEIIAVTSFWRETHDEVGLIYIGISDFRVSGYFQPIGGGSAYIDWHSGEPNNLKGNEHCVLSYKDGTFLDDNCSPDRAFICKKDSSELECGADYRGDYRYLETTQAYYKFHTQAKPWINARHKCESEGALLFYPKNEAEIRAVTNFWKETQYNVDLIYLGISDLLEKGYFEPINGGVAYIQWHSGEPNDATGNERCVLSYKDGTFLDDSCSIARAYICKKLHNGGTCS